MDKSIETGSEDLLARVEDGVAILTLNRPEAKNAMSASMNKAMRETFAAVEFDPEVKCVVLTGAGRAFCAGGDVKGMAAASARTEQGVTPIDRRIHEQRINQRETAGRLYRMPKPTLAALPGAAAGAGLCLALACDLRVMSRNAIMTTAFARIGYSGDFGGSYFLAQLVGAAKAKELYYLSDRIGAEEAKSLGLANWVCDADELQGKTMEIARRLANGPSIAYRYMKENLNRALNEDMEACMDLEATHHRHCGQTEDHQEAIKAFVEKREPVFQGK
ncbi:MAG: enoyl-CoA hydratase/isomerase family protein [Pseudomonadales bacterium]|nr:enoyl-CoA hydratase/isomerase family protein [Pseudomonadales bacterium]